MTDEALLPEEVPQQQPDDQPGQHPDRRVRVEQVAHARSTAERAARLDAFCAELGRDPRSIRRSVTCFPPLTPWTSVAYFEEMVDGDPLAAAYTGVPGRAP